MAVGQLPEQAPDFTLDHVLGHKVSLSDYRGRPVVVVFGGRESVPQVKNGINTIRRAHGASDVEVLGVSDLREAPRPARIIVKSQMKKAFEEAVQAEAATAQDVGRQPDGPDHVLMLMDWSGETVDSYGLNDVEHEAVGVVIDPNGRVLGSGRGDALGEEVLALLGSQ
jgi:cytochrome oxidase Cu insertion factor (SCO1/SenC/PrrC family)